MTTTSDTIRQDIITKVMDLPALPASATELVTRLQDAEVNIDELVSIIELDPGLTVNVLRWANSPYFGGTSEITSIQNAVVRLGLNGMHELIVTSIAAPVLLKEIRGYDLPAGALLDHSIATAAATEEIAELLGILVDPQVFTAGLLHDVGKTVLGLFIEVGADSISDIAKAEGVAFDAAERKALGIDHAEVGALLLTNWGFSPSIIDAVRWHHDPGEFSGDDQGTLDLVHVGQMLSIQCGFGAETDQLFYAPDEAVLARIGLEWPAPAALIEKIRAEVEQAREFRSGQSS